MRPDCFPPHPADPNFAETQGVGRVGYGLQYEILKAIILMIFYSCFAAHKRGDGYTQYPPCSELSSSPIRAYPASTEVKCCRSTKQKKKIMPASFDPWENRASSARPYALIPCVRNQ